MGLAAVAVGDDARIGANATVVRDVPTGAVTLAPAAVVRWTGADVQGS